MKDLTQREIQVLIETVKERLETWESDMALEDGKEELIETLKSILSKIN